MIRNIFLVAATALLLAGCTGKVNVADTQSTSDKSSAGCEGKGCASCILPWGGALPGGESMNSVYIQDLVQCGKSCNDHRGEVRCNQGQLEFRLPGKPYQALGRQSLYRSCYLRKCDCNHNGTVVADGADRVFYEPKVVACGTSCKSKKLICANGTMKDAAQTNPEQSAPQIYTAAACNNTCKACALPDGGKVQHGTSTVRYKAATSPCGTACSTLMISLYCNDGTFSGSPNLSLYPATACQNPTDCDTCTTPSGLKLQNGEKFSFFKLKNVPCGTSCYSNGNQVTLTCASGQFADRSVYPQHTQGSCESACDPTGPKGDKNVGRISGDGGGAPVWFCSLPWGSGVVSHLTKVVAYSRMKVPKTDKCSNYRRLIECNGYKGLWNGGATYIYSSCKEDP